MRFQHIDSSGHEAAYPDESSLTQAILAGKILPTELLMDRRLGSWKPAGDHPIFRAVQSGEHHVNSPGSIEPEHTPATSPPPVILGPAKHGWWARPYGQA